jgi:hypothetical protein
VIRPCHGVADMRPFRATIELLGINPYVSLPAAQLKALFAAAGRETGAIPVLVEIEAVAFRQNLVKYRGAWRLYLNMPMRRAAGKDVGDRIRLAVDFDPAPRVEPMPRALRRALADNAAAQAAFGALPPSRKKEIQRYLNGAKSAATVARNVDKIIAYLCGKEAPGLAVLTSRARKTRTRPAPSS